MSSSAVEAEKREAVSTATADETVSREDYSPLYSDTDLFIKIDTGRTNKENGKPIYSYKINYKHFVEKIDEAFHPVTFNEHTLYTYNEKTGLYEEGVSVVLSWIQDALYFISDMATEKISPGTPLNPIINELKERTMQYRVIPGKQSPFNKYPGIPLQNGVLTIDGDGEIIQKDYSPGMMFTRKLPVTYDPEAPTDRIKEILNSWLEDYDVLIQIPAQALYQSLPGKTPLKTAYILIGEANAGKSSYIHLLKAMFGEGNVSGVQLGQLGGRFCKSDMVGMFLNIGDDLPDIEVSAYNTFKDITGARTHRVEPKHKAAYNADITAVHVYAANKPPELEKRVSDDPAFWDRWVLLKFENTFEKIGGWEEANFTEENKSGFLNLVIESLKKILTGGKLHYVQDLEDVREQWKYAASPLHEFLEEHTERNASETIPKEEFFDNLMKWVEDIPNSIERDQTRRRLPTSITDLTQKLTSEGVETRYVGKKNNRKWVYSGIKWKPGSKYNPVKTENSQIT